MEDWQYQGDRHDRWARECVSKLNAYLSDVAEVALEHCRNRFIDVRERMIRERKTPFEAHFLPADASKVLNRRDLAGLLPASAFISFTSSLDSTSRQIPSRGPAVRPGQLPVCVTLLVLHGRDRSSVRPERYRVSATRRLLCRNATRRGRHRVSWKLRHAIPYCLQALPSKRRERRLQEQRADDRLRRQECRHEDASTASLWREAELRA